VRNVSEVLARKYRPSNFEELIGQESIAQTLSLALDSKRLSHAYLFSGLRGSGKTSTARIFAKALICEKGVTHQPCGVCPNCVMAIENRHMDIVEMDGASSRKIDDIRDLIEQTKYRPASARFKIFIIDEVHMLTKEAFNALLKTLEEPPEYVKFILATTDPLKLPATILSRTQHFRFKSIATNKIIDHLAHILNLEQISYEHDALEILARSGSGSLRDTLTLLDQAIIYSKSHVDVTTVTDMLGLVDPKFISDIFNAIFAKNYAKIVEFIKLLEDYEAQMVVDELIAYLKEKMYAQDPIFSTLVLDRFFRILSDSKSLFSMNADGSFVLSLIFFKMVEALRIKEVDQMIESLQKEVQRPQIKLVQETPISLTQQTTQASAIAQDMPRETSEAEEMSDDGYYEEESLYQDTMQEPIQEEIVAAPSHEEILFEQLIAKIKDRNYETGLCFEKSIRFVSFEENLLTWESCADDVCRESLKHGYGVIRQLVRETYGIATQIKGLPCSKEITKEPTPSQESVTQPTTSHAMNAPSEQNSALHAMNGEESEPTSMIEESEIGGSASCVSNCSPTDASTKEINGDDITQEPMVQKAIELFEANKITIQSKI
jgi:DNA polymerase-3 subunit gamma/tau